MVRAVLFSDNIKHYKTIYDAAGSEFEFKVVRYTGGNNVILSISGVEDRNTAKSLKGSCFFVKKDDLPNLSDDEFYICDLMGKVLKIVGHENASRCIISNVYNFGASYLIEVTYESDSFLVPFTKENFPNGDSDADIQMTFEAFNLYKN